MTPDDYFRVVFGLFAVLGLIGLAALVARKAGLVTASNGFARKRRLALVETMALDARRKLAIIRCDGREHLVILGAQSETLIESGLSAPAAESAETTSTPPRNPFAELRRALGETRSGARAA